MLAIWNSRSAKRYLSQPWMLNSQPRHAPRALYCYDAEPIRQSSKRALPLSTTKSNPNRRRQAPKSSFFDTLPLPGRRTGPRWRATRALIRQPGLAREASFPPTLLVLVTSQSWPESAKLRGLGGAPEASRWIDTSYLFVQPALTIGVRPRVIYPL